MIKGRSWTKKYHVLLLLRLRQCDTFYFQHQKEGYLRHRDVVCKFGEFTFDYWEDIHMLRI